MDQFDVIVATLAAAALSILLARLFDRLGLARLSSLSFVVGSLSAVASIVLLYRERAFDLFTKPTECGFDIVLCDIDRTVALFWIMVGATILLYVVAVLLGGRPKGRGS